MVVGENEAPGGMDREMPERKLVVNDDRAAGVTVTVAGEPLMFVPTLDAALGTMRLNRADLIERV